MLYRRLSACLFALIIAQVGAAQLHIGNSNVLGFHSNFQRRPIYYYAGTSFSSIVLFDDSEWAFRPSVGLGYALELSPRMYVAVEGVLRLDVDETFVTSNNNPQELQRDYQFKGALAMAAFVSTSKHNRDFLKLSLPVLRSRESFLPASLGLVSFFGRKGEYLAPERTRGPIVDTAFRLYAEMRYGWLYGAQAVGIRAGAAKGRFDLTVGTLFGRRVTFNTIELHFLDVSDAIVTGSVGFIVRRRELARTQVVGEAAIPFGSTSLRGGNRRRMLASGAIFLRHLQPLSGSRTTVSVEAGLDGSSVETVGPDIDGREFSIYLNPRINIGLRYRLSPS